MTRYPSSAIDIFDIVSMFSSGLNMYTRFYRRSLCKRGWRVNSFSQVVLLLFEKQISLILLFADFVESEFYVLSGLILLMFFILEIRSKFRFSI